MQKTYPTAMDRSVEKHNYTDCVLWVHPSTVNGSTNSKMIQHDIKNDPGWDSHNSMVNLSHRKWFRDNIIKWLKYISYKREYMCRTTDKFQLDFLHKQRYMIQSLQSKLITFGKPWLVDEPNNNLKLWHHILLGFFIILFNMRMQETHFLVKPQTLMATS